MGKGLKGTNRDKSGHVDTEAFMCVSEIAISYKQKKAQILFEIYRNEESAELGEIPTESVTIPVNAEETPVRLTMEGDVLYTIPKFDDVFGVDKFTKTSEKLFAQIKKHPEYKNWTDI